MAENTSIEWCRHTFNPWLGCSKVHAGCTHCYAESHQAVAMRKGGRVKWGEVWAGGQRVVTSESTWAMPRQWARAAAKAGERHRVFCASLADVLEVPALPKAWPSGWGEEQRGRAARDVHRTGYALDEAREQLWDIIRKTATVWPDGGASFTKIANSPQFMQGPGLDWLLLTKRPENWALVPEDVRPLAWLGTSISDQKTADEMLPRLLASRGFRYRFLSLEPMTGPVDLGLFGTLPKTDFPNYTQVHQALDWVIVGGESGPGARECREEWFLDIVRQCMAADIPVLVKQLGVVWARARGAKTVKPVKNEATGKMEPREVFDSKGGDMKNWPPPLRVRMFPGARWEG